MINKNKKEEAAEEIERLRNSVKEVRQYQNKVLFALKALEKGFALDRIAYAPYAEKKEKLSNLKKEYGIYLHRARENITVLEENLKKEKWAEKLLIAEGMHLETSRVRTALAFVLLFLMILPLFVLVLFPPAGITGANIDFTNFTNISETSQESIINPAHDNATVNTGTQSISERNAEKSLT